MSYIFKKYPNRPLQRSNGVYLIDNNLTDGEMGKLNGWNLDTGMDREKFSLGNWNSKVRNNIKIVSPHNKDLANFITGGRPVRLKFAPNAVIMSRIEIRLEDEASGGLGTIKRIIDPMHIPFSIGNWRDNDNTGLYAAFNWQEYYPGLHDTFTDPDHNLLPELRIEYDDGIGRIQERTDWELSHARLRIKLDSNLASKINTIVNTHWVELRSETELTNLGWSGAQLEWKKQDFFHADWR